MTEVEAKHKKSGKSYSGIEVLGTEDSDLIEIDETAGQARVNGAVVASFDGAANNGFEVKALGGNDTIIIDSDGDDKYEIKAGDGNDIVAINDGAGNDKFEAKGEAGDDLINYIDTAGDEDEVEIKT